MKSLTTLPAILFLAACAGPHYHSVQPAAEGQYFIARSPAHTVHSGLSYYGAFQAYGIYPWWNHAYYSPNFYPHYFAVWYPPAWPYGHSRYYGHHAYYGRSGLYGHGLPPHRGRPGGTRDRQTDQPTPAPVETAPGPTVRVSKGPAGRGNRPPSTADLTDLEANTLRRRHWPLRPVPAPSASLPSAAESASMPRPAARPLTAARPTSRAIPSRPTTQSASRPTKPRTLPGRERGLSRRGPAPYDP